MVATSPQAFWLERAPVPEGEIEIVTCRGIPPRSYFSGPVGGPAIGRIFISNLPFSEILRIFRNQKDDCIVLCPNAYFSVINRELTNEVVDPPQCHTQYSHLHTVATLVCLRAKYTDGFDWLVGELRAKLTKFAPISQPRSPPPTAPLPPVPLLKKGSSRAIGTSLEDAPASDGVSPILTWPTLAKSGCEELPVRPAAAVPARAPRWNLRNDATPRKVRAPCPVPAPAEIPAITQSSLGQTTNGDGAATLVPDHSQEENEPATQKWCRRMPRPKSRDFCETTATGPLAFGTQAEVRSSFRRFFRLWGDRMRPHLHREASRLQ